MSKTGDVLGVRPTSLESEPVFSTWAYFSKEIYNLFKSNVILDLGFCQLFHGKRTDEVL